MSYRRFLALSAVLTIAAPLSAQQAIINRETGLTPSELVRTLPFTLAMNLEEIDNALLETEGVSFENALFLSDPIDGQYPIPNGAATIGFADATGDAITMSFSSPVSAVAFQAFAQFVPEVSETRFEAFSGSTLLGSFSGRPQDPLLSRTQALRWWGFEGGSFDRLVIWAPTTPIESGVKVWGLGLTDITIADVPAAPSEVPEPAMLILLVAGVVGLALRASSSVRRQYR